MKGFVLFLTLWHLKRPKVAIKDPGSCPACDVITFYPEMLKQNTFSEKLGGKFTLSTLYLSMVSTCSSCIVYAFSEILLLERSLVEGQKLQQKEREKKKRESDKKKIERTKSLSPNFDWCTCTSEKVVKHDSGEKQGRILRFKGCFE